MNIWRGFDEIPSELRASVVTIGVFDGMHRGHKTLLDTAVGHGKKLGVPTVLLTFDPHPLAVLRPDRIPPMLATVAQRAKLAEAEGIDHMLAMSFSADMARLSPEEFFTQVIVNSLQAKAVVVGSNFTFGYKAAGTTDTLQELGEKYGVEVFVLNLLEEEDEIICSTMIRGLLAQGDVARANWALGRTFSVSGEVVRGAGRGGKELGFPTANLYFPDSVALPKDGVYAGWLRIVSTAPVEGDMQPGVRYPAAISVGDNPTFGDARRSVESYVINQDADLYGHTVEVEFVDFVRDMLTFSSVEELVATIKGDVRTTLEIVQRDDVTFNSQ
ncbi:MAG: bifunctional riboflavin kinase/FAD synthetase [Corynebacterium sp.]|uniref:bifunctional riboflavin kinase/FAD synthetase n=1 Tax=Corynebacterium sp. TaxID=1720 RepID=UPI0026DADB8C|nr:bifunctional riboflavin kinase/FAD synthetase [Corynebacterium sp.]MDO4762564.1 bifunctional riboflavin kinase/FAD synthetase [Corynebacterium sp.]